MLIANYITSAWRNILRHKLFSIINIMGLAIGLAAVMLIALYVRYETSYDSFWKNADNIYQVNTNLNIPGRDPDYMSWSSYPTIQTMTREFSEIDKAGSFGYMTGTVRINNENFHEHVNFADPGLFDVFEFNILDGDINDAMSNPKDIVISRTFAEKHFPDKSPIGETVSFSILGVEQDYTIKAVFQDLPKNTTMIMNAFVPLDPQKWDRFQSFTQTNVQSFFTLKNGYNIENISSRIDAMVDRTFPEMPFEDPNITASDVMKIYFIKITDLHTNALGLTMIPIVSNTTIVIFSSVSVTILIIACINFMNLSTARASRRAKEVSLRKVVGAGRKQLIQQFLGESLIIAFIALMIALATVEVSMPIFNTLVNRDLSIEYTFYTIGLMFLLTIIAGLLGGLYPAFYLSRYRPSEFLGANQSTENKNTLTFRSLLVVFQFTASIILFVSTLVIMGQMNFTMTKDLGYKPENLITVWGYSVELLPPKADIVQRRLSQIDGVENVTWTSTFEAGVVSDGSNPFRTEDMTDGYRQLTRREIGYNFFDTFKIPIIAGRDFDKNRNDILPSIEQIANDEGYAGSIVINEAAVKFMGLGSNEESIGKRLFINLESYGDQEIVEGEFNIIGVIPEVNLGNLKQEPAPEYFRLRTDTHIFMVARYNGEPATFIEQAKKIWFEEMPENSFDYSLAFDMISEQYMKENGELAMFAAFSGLAIFIACLGLFGLASFTAERRTKEIGIRKVFGAEVWQIVRMLVFQFSKPVLIANIIAWPVAYLAMSRWLESFVYRIDDMVIIALCLVAGLTALLIAWATVAGNSYAVARQNPIKALRYE